MRTYFTFGFDPGWPKVLKRTTSAGLVPQAEETRQPQIAQVPEAIAKNRLSSRSPAARTQRFSGQCGIRGTDGVTCSLGRRGSRNAFPFLPKSTAKTGPDSVDSGRSGALKPPAFRRVGSSFLPRRASCSASGLREWRFGRYRFRKRWQRRQKVVRESAIILRPRPLVRLELEIRALAGKQLVDYQNDGTRIHWRSFFEKTNVAFSLKIFSW